MPILFYIAMWSSALAMMSWLPVPVESRSAAPGASRPRE
jgi:hypothetical protein